MATQHTIGVFEPSKETWVSYIERLEQFFIATDVDKVEYFGHTISADGLQPSESKTRAVVDAPQPQNVSQLRSFLGMVNYYGKFLPKIATKLAPMYRLLKKGIQWRWGSVESEVFVFWLNGIPDIVTVKPYSSIAANCIYLHGSRLNNNWYYYNLAWHAHKPRWFYTVYTCTD